MSLLREIDFGGLRFSSPSGGYQASRSWIDLAGEAATEAAVDVYLASRISKDLLSIISAAGATRFGVPHLGIAARKLS